MALDTQDKAYIAQTVDAAINTAFDKNRVEFREEMSHIVGAYHEAVRSDIRLVSEAVDARPTEGRVREIKALKLRRT